MCQKLSLHYRLFYRFKILDIMDCKNTIRVSTPNLYTSKCAVSTSLFDYIGSISIHLLKKNNRSKNEWFRSALGLIFLNHFFNIFFFLLPLETCCNYIFSLESSQLSNGLGLIVVCTVSLKKWHFLAIFELGQFF